MNRVLKWETVPGNIYCPIMWWQMGGIHEKGISR